MSNKKFISDNFSVVCQRLKDEIGVAMDKELIDIIGTSQPTFSRRKAENNFSLEWAYLISINYGLEIKWILTGKGSKNSTTNLQNFFLNSVSEWIEETSSDGGTAWFENQFIRCFPDFLRWREKKELRIVTSPETPEKNVA